MWVIIFNLVIFILLTLLYFYPIIKILVQFRLKKNVLMKIYLITIVLTQIIALC